MSDYAQLIKEQAEANNPKPSALTEKDVWVMAATNAVINVDAESAIMRADKITIAFHERFVKKE